MPGPGPREVAAPSVPDHPILSRFIGEWQAEGVTIYVIAPQSDGSVKITSPRTPLLVSVINAVHWNSGVLHFDEYVYSDAKDRVGPTLPGVHPYGAVRQHNTLILRDDSDTLVHTVRSKVFIETSPRELTRAKENRIVNELVLTPEITSSHAARGDPVSVKVTGRVLDSRGREAPGVSIALYAHEGAASEYQAISDIDGAFSFTIRDITLHNPYTFLAKRRSNAVDHTGYTNVGEETGEIRVVLEEGSNDVGSIIIHGGRIWGSIAGTVYSYDGKALKEIRITYGPSLYVALHGDRKGQSIQRTIMIKGNAFFIPELEEDQHDIIVQADGYAPELVKGIDVGLGKGSLNVYLQVGNTLKGYVRTATGLPIKGAGVWFLSSIQDTGARSDESGYFAINNISAGEECSVFFNANGYKQSSLSLSAEYFLVNGSSLVEIHLTK